MAEDKEKGIVSKAIMSSIVGLISGAVLMYVSPLVNSAIKPPRPMPNFSYAVEGTQVVFNNRSTGASTGWWEFGDNTAQEPFNPNMAEVAHKFPGPGVYPVKLTLHNFIGEEADRVVQVKIETSAPRIDDLQLTLISSGASANGSPTAPARFRLVAKVQDLDAAFWVIDGQPTKPANPTQLASGLIVEEVTFDYYGTMQVKVFGVAGKNLVEKTKEIWVGVPDDSPRIMIRQASREEKSIPIAVSFPTNANGPVYPFEFRRTVEPGYKIVKANIMIPPDPKLVRNPRLDIAPDGKTIVVRGELLRPANAGKTNTPSWFGKVDVTVESATPSTARTDPVAAQLNLPGITRVKLPPSAPNTVAALQWEVREGMEVVMKDSDGQPSQIVKLRNQLFRVTVTRVGNEIQIDAADSTRPIPMLPTSNPR